MFPTFRAYRKRIHTCKRITLASSLEYSKGALTHEMFCFVGSMKPASEYLSTLRDAVTQRARRNAATPEAVAKSERTQPIEDIDYKQAAVDYPHRLDEDSQYYLRTKPFVNVANKTLRHSGRGLDAETRRFFSDFAGIVTALGLRSGQRILDVGCGPGWLSEFLARFGYHVTGVDISLAMIEIARERLQRVPYSVDPATRLDYRFIVHDIETAPLAETFDAIICYDSLHHFANEQTVLRHLAAMLDDGGLLFILEGDKPNAGSVAEQELIDEMRQFQTLESPFGGDYLRKILREQGFVIIGDYISVNGFFDRDTLIDNQLHVVPLAVNYLLCKKVSPAKYSAHEFVPDSRAPGVISARLSMLEGWPRQTTASALIEALLEIENTGNTVWLTGAATRRGAVTLGVKVFDANDHLIDEFHGEPAIEYALAPGESTTLSLKYRAPNAPGSYRFKIDLVDQQICWFEQHGSQPLECALLVR